MAKSSFKSFVAFDNAATLKEANTGSSNARTFKGVTLIKSGLGNMRDRHLYTPDAMREAVEEGMFDDLSAYVDHPNEVEEKIQPERTFRDLIGVYRNPRFVREGSGATVVADLTILEPHDWIAKGIRELARMGLGHKAGISILGSGRTTPDKYRLEESGEEIDVHRVDKFLRLKSADIVTQAGAGGGFHNLLESARTREQEDMDPKALLNQISEAAAAGDLAKVKELSAKLNECGEVGEAETAETAEATEETKENFAKNNYAEKTEETEEATEEKTEETEEATEEADEVAEVETPCACKGEKVAEAKAMQVNKRKGHPLKPAGKRMTQGRKFGESDQTDDTAALRRENARLRAQLQGQQITAHINKSLKEANLDENVETKLRKRLARMTDPVQIDEEIAYHVALSESIQESVLSSFDEIEGAGSSIRENAGGGRATIADRFTATVESYGLKMKAKK